MDLVQQFTGGDPGIEKSLGNLWKNEGPNLAQQYNNMPTQEMSEYIQKALNSKK